ncbi:MAG: hypothetical protein ACOY0T_10035 [Myxococcota bacterium]
MQHRFLIRLGMVTSLLVASYACGGGDRDYDSGSGGSNAGGSGNSGGLGGGANTGGKAAGGGAGKASGGSENGGAPTGGVGNEAGSGGTGNQAGAPSDAGAGGDIVDVTPGHPGSALVSGGQRMKSANYILVLTTGESPGGNQIQSSKNYRMIGGLMGTVHPE